MECPKCGMNLADLQVHPEKQCRKQQEINRVNRNSACTWCGTTGKSHKAGCPRKDDDDSAPGVEVMTRRR